MQDKPNVIRPTDENAIRLAKTLLRTARFGALAVLDSATGAPLASRVGVATDLDGTPLILVSMLAAHTGALLADPRCSLLLGEPGKGDALAHPRISLACKAERLDKASPDGERARRRYLNRNTKAVLYAELGDFHFFRLAIQSASLNGGFGRAYLLETGDLVGPDCAGLAESEQGALDHMNSDHLDAVALYARHFAGLEGDGWTISGFDAEGIDLINGDRTGRVWFPFSLETASALRKTLVDMANAARNL
jgi:putative heme iron utilization protein